MKIYIFLKPIFVLKQNSRKHLDLVEKRGLNELKVYTFFQTVIGILDLIGILLFMLVSQLVQDKKPTSVARFSEYLQISQFSKIQQVTIISSLALSMLLLKTVISIILNRKLLISLANRAANTSTDLISKISGHLTTILEKYSTQEAIFFTTRSIENIYLQILANGVYVIADFALVVIIFIGIVFLNPWISLFIVLFFLYLSISMYLI